MEDKKLEKKEDVSMMFLEDDIVFENDDELALHIYQRFNICRDTLEDMPAFEKHLNCLFNVKEEK